MGTFRRAFALTRASWSVLRQDKELVVLPLLAVFASVMAAVVYVLVVLSLEPGVGTAPAEDPPNAFVHVALAAGLHAWCVYAAVFCNVALLCAADERLRGGDPTLRSALRAAASRAIAIVPWAVLSATVLFVLRPLIRERTGIVGRVLGAMFQITWAALTYFVLPVLVFERTGVRAAISRSRELFRRTWGENVVASTGLFALASSVAFAGAALAVSALLAWGPADLLVIEAVVAVWCTAVFCVWAALSGILRFACYRYAVDGTVPGFGGELIQAAFSRRGRGAGAR